MTNQEILDVAKGLGWNMEHEATNQMLIAFARAIKKLAYNTDKNVVLIKENKDGSAVYSFDFDKDETDALTRLGIITAIKSGIEAAKKYHPDHEGEGQLNLIGDEPDVL
jgi:hypothetical protein